MKNRNQVLILLALFACCVSCSLSPEGYLEVRNQSSDSITNVRWGTEILLGDIAPGEEKGQETLVFDSAYVSFTKDNMTYRSSELIKVDARTSATYILTDSTSIVIDSQNK